MARTNVGDDIMHQILRQLPHPEDYLVIMSWCRLLSKLFACLEKQSQLQTISIDKEFSSDTANMPTFLTITSYVRYLIFKAYLASFACYYVASRGLWQRDRRCENLLMVCRQIYDEYRPVMHLQYGVLNYADFFGWLGYPIQFMPLQQRLLVKRMNLAATHVGHAADTALALMPQLEVVRIDIGTCTQRVRTYQEAATLVFEKVEQENLKPQMRTGVKFEIKARIWMIEEGGDGVGERAEDVLVDADNQVILDDY